MNQAEKPYVHALRFAALTSLYDPIIALTTREKTFKAALLDAAALQASDRVLDVGCGTGTLAIQAKQQTPTIEIHGIDGDPAILQRARSKSRRADVAIEYREAMSFDLPYPDASFDRVLSSLFFHHLSIEDKLRTFREIHRVTADDGSLYVADWGAPQNALMRLAFFGIQLLDGFTNTRPNIEGRLPDLMQQAGFKQVRIVRNISTLFGTMAIYAAAR